MKILLLSKYTRLGASSRLRSLQYLPYLESLGHHVKVSPLFDDLYLQQLYGSKKRSASHVFGCYYTRLLVLFSFFKYDVIWVEKEIFPYLPAFAERLLRLFNKAYVVDYDDAIFHNYDLSKNIFIRLFLKKKIDVVMQHARCVLAGNQYLVNKALKSGAQNVIYVPTVVDFTRYSLGSLAEGLDRDKISIGWVGSPSTQKYVLDIKIALNTVCSLTNARLILVGANDDIKSNFPGVDVLTVPWSEDSEVKSIQKFDIGIMPLIDGPWEQGKCGYKLIQYMACGVPVVASPVGVNQILVSSTKSGLLAMSTQDWIDSLLSLIESSLRRSTMGESGRQAVQDKYSMSIQAPVIEEALFAATKKN